MIVLETTYSYTMFKEINKGESYKCLEHAEQCIQKKQFELAEKYITKSKKLYFLLEADGKFINYTNNFI